jgi:hypothetical protein
VLLEGSGQLKSDWACRESNQGLAHVMSCLHDFRLERGRRPGRLPLKLKFNLSEAAFACWPRFDSRNALDNSADAPSSVD